MLRKFYVKHFEIMKGENMEKRTGYLMGDQELHLIGPELKVGDKAPDFNLLTKDMKPISLKDFDGKVKIISAVPSLDTKVCELETIRFNEEADKLGQGLAVITVSLDLPFAQQRFCGDKGIHNLTVASDYQERSFSKDYGVLIDELKLMNRSVFVLDKDNKFVHVEYVKQNTDFPDFDKALEAAGKLL